MAFPSTILSLAHAAASNFLSAWFGGTVAHSEGDNMIIDDLVGAETKIGTSESSAQDTPLADTGLFSDTNGKSKWQKAQTRHIGANAVTQIGSATGTSGTTTTTSTSLVDLTDMSVTLTTAGGDLLVWF